ncbi:hypothetical protein [Natrinema soli]|uniref:Flavodoxin-like domain-containing protein n=1 Tax=Natrinema soli TaxID=1930624 RepID=A0ABD5SGE2_9EURY|nr:hypothetical protein [Natrinema soli]
MGSILVSYGSGEGQTATVADRIGDVLADRGHDATATNIDEVPADFVAFVEGRLCVRPPEMASGN